MKLKKCLKRKKTEKPDKILKIVKEVLDFSKKSKTAGFGTKNTNTKSNA